MTPLFSWEPGSFGAHCLSSEQLVTSPYQTPANSTPTDPSQRFSFGLTSEARETEPEQGGLDLGRGLLRAGAEENDRTQVVRS